MQEYYCEDCGYIYDPAVGDPGANVDVGIPFETLPEDWKCPQCGAPKTHFELDDGPIPGMVVPVGEE